MKLEGTTSSNHTLSQVTDRPCPEPYSDLIPGLGQLQRFCAYRTADCLHDLVARSCLAYAHFLRSFEPYVPEHPQPLPSVVTDKGQLFSMSLLSVRVWMETPEGEARPKGISGLMQRDPVKLGES